MTSLDRPRRPQPHPHPLARARVAAVALLAALVAAGGLAACSGGGYPSGAPVLTVATGLFPLAQLVGQVAQGQVRVLDVIPPGHDPTTYTLTPAEVRTVRRASLVVDIGGGFQPSFERASTGARRVVSLRDALGATDPRVWLDPGLFQRAIGVVASAMSRANPRAAKWYGNGARAYRAAVSSLDIDYRSTLSGCPDRTVFTADGAFDRLAHRYGLATDPLGTSAHPPPKAVAAAAKAVQASGAGAVFRQPWVDDATITAVAAAAGVKVRTLDTLEGPPPGGWPPHATYADLMEANLGALSSALHCPNTESMTQ